MQILRAIVAGERDAETLGQLRDKRCRRSPAEIAKALTGNYRSEHIFALKQALALYDFYTAQIADCDAEMERQYAALQPIADAADLPPQTSRKRNSHSKNAPQFDARTQLFRITGVDLVAVTGLDESSVQTIISEIGTDVSRFPTVKHFCSWLTVAPHNAISGGKVLHSRTLKARNRAGQAFRMAAQAVMRTQTPFGAFYRRLAARIGKEQAIVATAHKIARVVYAMLKHQRPFESTSQEAYERQHQERELKRLKRELPIWASNSYHSQDEPLTLKFLSSGLTAQGPLRRRPAKHLVRGVSWERVGGATPGTVNSQRRISGEAPQARFFAGVSQHRAFSV